MKLGNVPRHITTWMTFVDRAICAENSNTNPYLATFFTYVALLMGVIRDYRSSMELLESLDDIYEFMVPQAEGLAVLCLIMCAAETIMLCGNVFDSLMRFIVVVLFFNFFYMMGMFLTELGYVLLAVAALAYVLRLVQLVAAVVRKARSNA